MKPIKRLMKKHKTVLRGFRRLLICSTVLLLSACAGLPKFPTDRLWEFDPKSNVCGEYQITDAEKMQFRHLRDVPREQCPAIFGFKSDTIPKVLDWASDAIAYSKQHCN